MFVRLTISELHDESGQEIGIFHAVRYLRDDGDLTEAEENAANEVFDWIFDHLEAPANDLLVANPTAISWFRADAIQHLSYAQRLITILEAHGYRVIRAASDDPGDILYADAIQVFALPRRAEP